MGSKMTPPLPRLLLMCLALAFASLWFGCGPEDAEEEDGVTSDDFVPVDVAEDEPVCAL